MPVYVESAAHKAMREATASMLRHLADLVENGDPIIETVAFDTVRSYASWPNHRAVPLPEPERITYELKVVTFGLEVKP